MGMTRSIKAEKREKIKKNQSKMHMSGRGLREILSLKIRRFFNK